MSDIQDVQRVLMGKTEALYQEYHDGTNANALVDPVYPLVSLYDPVGTFVSSGQATQESTGVYYYSVNISTPAANKEGIDPAYWEGSIGSQLVTTDEPQYSNVTRVPWQITEPNAIISSIRRLVGDNNPDRYVISTREMYYFLQDAVDEVQAEINFGYIMSITNTSISWNQVLRSNPFVLFKTRCLILVLESRMHDFFYDAGLVQVGDIKIDIVPAMKIRREILNDLRKEYKELLYEVKMNSGASGGYNIDTHKIGLIVNTLPTSEGLVYDFYGV